MIETRHRCHATPQIVAHRAVSFVLAEPVRVYNLAVIAVPDASQPQHVRPLLALRRHIPLVEYLATCIVNGTTLTATQLSADMEYLADLCGLSIDKVRTLLPSGTRRSGMLTRPLVLRAGQGEILHLCVANRLANKPLRLALVDDDFGIQQSQDVPMALPGEMRRYIWHCTQPGIYPIHNQAYSNRLEQRCLLGVLIIEGQ